ncbi:hypothetical protein [Bifidobacterium sp. ESL0745]|uniref:hypothetical protein n=1 Tax=Bifidobacterium sp. ESL0745 TaxID=2983226 RepID=UPI0023F74CCB|nr:hypothetical protein [Bifidobacterium sp. ESL0745]MDF7665738.1 hypothetical protein [Bifidobacterium sp. ESL0745]
MDVFANDARGTSRRQRIADEANLPSGSQPYQTTAKMRKVLPGIDAARQDAAQAQADAVAAEQAAGDAQRKAVQALQASVEQAQGLDVLSGRVTKVEGAVAELAVVPPPEIVSGSAQGFGLTGGSGWQALASLPVPPAPGMRALIGVTVTGVAVSHGPSPLRVRVCVDGRSVGESVAAYGGDTRIMPGALTGEHAITLAAFARANPAALVTLEAMSLSPADWPADEDNMVFLTVRVDWRRADRGIGS